MMTNGDTEGLIFLSHPRMNIGFFFLVAIKNRHLTTMCVSSNTTNVQSSRDSLGKITWVR